MERLVLRAFRDDDLAAYAAMCADAEVMRYIGDGSTVGSAAAWRHMALFNGTWSLRGCGMWAIERRADGALIGRAGFLDPPDWPALELGWLLARDAWGAGCGREAAGAALDYARSVLRPPRLVSLIRPGNERSIRLAKALGARCTGEHSLFGSASLLYEHDLAAG